MRENTWAGVRNTWVSCVCRGKTEPPKVPTFLESLLLAPGGSKLLDFTVSPLIFNLYEVGLVFVNLL